MKFQKRIESLKALRKATKNPSINQEGIDGLLIDSLLGAWSSTYVGICQSSSIDYSNDLFNKIHIQTPIFSLVFFKNAHWIAVIKNLKCVYYIDSLGDKCVDKDMITFLKKFNLPVLENPIQYQSNYSNFCGYFVIFFILWFEKDYINLKCFPLKTSILSHNDHLVIKNICKMMSEINNTD